MREDSITIFLPTALLQFRTICLLLLTRTQGWVHDAERVWTGGVVEEKDEQVDCILRIRHFFDRCRCQVVKVCVACVQVELVICFLGVCGGTGVMSM